MPYHFWGKFSGAFTGGAFAGGAYTGAGAGGAYTGAGTAGAGFGFGPFHSSNGAFTTAKNKFSGKLSQSSDWISPMQLTTIPQNQQTLDLPDFPSMTTAIITAAKDPEVKKAIAQSGVLDPLLEYIEDYHQKNGDVPFKGFECTTRSYCAKCKNSISPLSKEQDEPTRNLHTEEGTGNSGKPPVSSHVFGVAQAVSSDVSSVFNQLVVLAVIFFKVVAVAPRLAYSFVSYYLHQLLGHL